MLTSNCESPYVIWNNSTRSELMDFLESKRKEHRCEKSSTLLQKTDLTYSVHEKELIIGNIFIRIYNAQPDVIIQVNK